jgi:ribulose-5-phosphate 4-epimerase/fuculose-1-phosphate aldolase
MSAPARVSPSRVAENESRIALAAALRAAALYGFNEGIDNHFSLVVPGTDDRFLLNSSGPHWSEIRASDLLTVDLDGRVVEGDGTWDRSAFVIHSAAHRARADACCVLHTHMPYATALAMTEGGLETRASQNSMLFHGRIARLSYGGVANAEEEGERIAGALGDGISVVMLDNHGPLVVGSSVAEAWYRLYFLERACQAQVLAQSTGSPLRLVSEDVAAHTAAQWDAAGGAEELFAAVRRQLDRELPGYAD